MPGEWRLPSLPGLGQAAPTTPMDEATAQLELKRRLAQAEFLRNQETPQGQMVSGIYVAPSWTQYLGNLANKYVSGQQEREAIGQYGEFQKGRKQKMAEALQQLNKDLQGTQKVTQGSFQVQRPTEQIPTSPFGTMDANAQTSPYGTGVQGQAPINVPMATTEMVAPTTQDRYAALMRYSAAIDNPEMVGRAVMGNIEALNRQEEVAGERAFKREETAAERKWREQQTAKEQEFQRILLKDRQGFELTQQEKNFANQMALQKSSQGFQAGENAKNRQFQASNAPLVSVLDPVTGKPKLVTRQSALGMQPYTAAQEAKDVQKIRGGENFDTLIAGLRDNYNQLGQLGAITSTKQGTLSNIGAGIASSGVGQATGRLFGTEAQSLRNRIAQSRPLLLNAIKEATGMSAKQMDSNAELKMYLAAATDPALDLQTNLNALAQLERLYGTGRQSAGAPAGGQGNVVDFGSLK